MPQTRDTDWREKIPRVVLEVIAKEGLEAASIRRIASELGTSTAVITHNFATKQELLLWSYGQFSDNGDRRYRKIMADNPADLKGYLVTMAAIDEDIALWRAYVAVWDKSFRDPEFAVQLKGWMSRAIVRIEGFIERRNPSAPRKNLIAKRLLALAEGISVQRILDVSRWSLDELREALSSEVDALLGPPEIPLQD